MRNEKGSIQAMGLLLVVFGLGVVLITSASADPPEIDFGPDPEWGEPVIVNCAQQFGPACGGQCWAEVNGANIIGSCVLNGSGVGCSCAPTTYEPTAPEFPGECSCEKSIACDDSGTAIYEQTDTCDAWGDQCRCVLRSSEGCGVWTVQTLTGVCS